MAKYTINRGLDIIKPMNSNEALNAGYMTGGTSIYEPVSGFEVLYDDGTLSWMSSEEFRRNTAMPELEPESIKRVKEKAYYTNKKNGSEYFVHEVGLIDSTNTTSGRCMILYMGKDGIKFVREEQEFLDKFELSPDKSITFNLINQTKSY